jgi:hypothetical protein
MVDITIDEITESTLDGSGYFDKFMLGVNAHLKEQYDKHRIKSSEYSGVYLGALQSALTEAVKLAVGRQLASAQADLAIANTSKVEVDKDLVRAEISLKNAQTDNVITEKGLISERITNLEKDTLIKIQQELLEKEKILQAQEDIKKTSKEIDKLVADIAKVNQDTANALSQNAVIVAEASRVLASTDKIIADTKLTNKQVDKVTKEIDLLTQEILVKSKEVQLMIAKISLMGKEELKVVAETSLIATRVKLVGKEIEKLTEEIKNLVETTKLTTAKTSQIKCETNKCGSEINLLKAKVDTEKANTDGSVIKSGSIIKENLALTKQKIETEKANVDGSVIKEDSVLDIKNSKTKEESKIIKAKYNPNGIVTQGSVLDCEAKLTCAKVESERANYTSIGEGDGLVAPDSLLGSKAKLTMAQAATEEANLNPEHVKEHSFFKAKTDKLEAEIISAKAQYDPEGAGVVIGSKLDCEAKLTCARVKSEAANYTPIGEGENDISPNSLIGAKAQFLINQGKTEEANIDGSVIKTDSLLDYKRNALKYDSKLKLAQYNPEEAGVTENSKLDCEAKLACAKAKAESAAYTEVGNGSGQIDPTSYLGARAILLANQAASELANVDGSEVKENSLIHNRIEKTKAEAKSIQAKFNPVDAGVIEGSYLDCEAELLCAKKSVELAQITSVGGDGVPEDSLIGSKASLYANQAKTEQANVDGTVVGKDSLYESRIAKAAADARVALAAIDPADANVDPESKVAYESDLIKAKSILTAAEYSAEQVVPDSIMDSKQKLLAAQADTELANTDGSIVKEDSYLESKINKAKADARAAKARYNPTDIVTDDSLLAGETKLAFAKAREATAQFTEIGNQKDQIDPTSLIGSRAALINAQAASEKATLTGEGVKEHSLMQAKVDKAEADVNLTKAQYKSGVADKNSKLGCEAQLACARSKVELAQITPVGEGNDALSVKSPLGAKVGLLEAQTATEKANTDGSGLGDTSFMKARIDKMIADAEVAKAPLLPVGEGNNAISENSKLGAETALMNARVSSEKANVIDPAGGLILAKIDYLKAQKESEEKNKDRIQEEIDASQAKYLSGKADENSLIGCQAKLYCAQAQEHEAKFKLPEGVTELSENTPMGAEVALLRAKTDSEGANVGIIPEGSGSGSEIGGLVGARIKLIAAQAAYEAQKTGLEGGTGGELTYAEAETLLMASKAKEALAKFTGENVVEDSYLGAEIDLMKEKKNLIEEQVRTQVKRTDVEEANKSLIDAKATVPPAQVSLYAAQAEHYDDDILVRKAKLYTDMFSISKTQGEESVVTATQATNAVNGTFTPTSG